MAVTPNQELRARIIDYLTGACTLAQFDDWFIRLPRPAIDEGTDEQAKELVAELEVRLAEFQHGDWTEAELRSLLQPLTIPGVVSVDIDMTPSPSAEREAARAG